MSDPRPVPLRRNRDFAKLWVGQFASTLGSQTSYVAYPLLILGLTGSPLLAGIAGTARAVPQWALGLVAGALVDRWDRRRLMLICDVVRLLALSTMVIGLTTGIAGFPLIVAVALVEGSATVVFSPAETTALRHVVPATQLREASARNESREYAAMLSGTPLGGALYSIASFVPFLFDAVSYLVSFLSIFLIRAPFRDEGPAGARQPIVASVADGVRWLWRQPFLRGSTVMVAATNLVGTALPTTLIVIATNNHVPPVAIGLILTMGGVGGLAGSVVAAWAARRVSPAWVVLGFPWVWAALLPLLLLRGSTVWVLGIVFGLMLAAAPLWNSVIFTYRVVLVPDELQGRVDSSCRFVTQSTAPLGPLLAGVLLEYGSATLTILALTGFTAVVGLVGAATRSLRHPPDIPAVIG